MIIVANLKAKAVIFDCDGVLVDSEVVYLNSLTEYIKSIGHDTSVEEIKHVVGMKIESIAKEIQSMFELTHLSIEEIVIGQRQVHHKNLKKTTVEIMPYLMNLIKELKSKKIKMAVASSSNREYVKKILEEINIIDYIDFYIGGDQVVNSKPNPEIFNKAISKLAVNTNEVIIIEDSANGIEAAKATGAFVVAYKGSEITQNTKGANLEVNDYSELKISGSVAKF